jgi:hypothetical protein
LGCYKDGDGDDGEAEKSMTTVMSAFLKHIYLMFFALVVVGFWYFTALVRTFYACFRGIPNYEGIDEHIFGAIILDINVIF